MATTGRYPAPPIPSILAADRRLHPNESGLTGIVICINAVDAEAAGAIQRSLVNGGSVDAPIAVQEWLVFCDKSSCTGVLRVLPALRVLNSRETIQNTEKPSGERFSARVDMSCFPTAAFIRHPATG